MSIITVGELLFGALNKKELRKINQDIAHLHLLHMDSAIGECFKDLMNNYLLSHGLSLPDGLIAATYHMEYTLSRVLNRGIVESFKLTRSAEVEDTVRQLNS